MPNRSGSPPARGQIPWAQGKGLQSRWLPRLVRAIPSSLSAVLAALLAGLAVTPAAAIPSPELIVNSLSSLSQLGALLSALLGGSAVLALGGRGKRSAASERRRQKLLWLALLTAAGLGGLNLYQWQSERETLQARLTATLSRPSRLPGQPSLDPTLKELGPAEQSRHPLGLSTEAAERIISGTSGQSYEILDIRESAEVEMGTFRAARAIRYPDLLAGGHKFSGKTAILICHNGNRSSESCMALAAKGIDCRFIVGGLERWISEGRAAGGFARSSVLEARAVPAFPNNDRLLDTPEVRALVEGQGARFVDVRYPGEHAAGHLPGAINIPMRRLATADLERAVAALPEVPIVVPCYDRRSCFFGELMGLALARKGRDFRGRYTLPWEYVPTIPPPPHVAAALAERNLGAWGKARRWLARAVDQTAARFGFLPVLLGLALLSRLLVLPFAIKAERDQIKSLAVEAEVRRLKAGLGDDPARLARALGQLYQEHGLTPLRNLLGLLGLPILMLAGGALGDAAALGSYQVGVLGALADADATWLTPALCAGLLGLYADWALARTRRQQIAVWLVLAPLTAIAMAGLPTASTLYFAASATLLLAQRAVVMGLAARREQGPAAPTNPRHLERAGILRLAAASAHAEVGSKAHRLGRMLQAGLPVPGGVVLTDAFLRVWPTAPEGRRRQLARLIARAAGPGTMAVRSSAAAEDGAEASHAGVYASITDVEEEGLPAAIDVVLASFSSERAGTYGTSASSGAIVVQRMVRAEFAGVVFTRAPDAPGLMLVEQVEGAGELLVSGLRTPVAFRFGRMSGAIVGRQSPPRDLAPLLDLCRRIEGLFGAPQDIEWVWAGGTFHIVQSRDITADASGLPPPVRAEWERVLSLAGGDDPKRAVLVRNELGEMLPRPTPAAHALIEALHGSGGSVDLACRSLGLAYNVRERGPELMPTVFGRLYLDSREAGRRAPRLSRAQVRRLVAQADAIERRVHAQFAPELRERIATLEATDFQRLELPALLQTVAGLRRSFVTATYVEAEIVNIVAEMLMGEARRGLEKAGFAPASWLGRRGATLVETVLQHAAMLPAPARLGCLAREIGHRAHLDYELSAPRLGENSQSLTDFFAAASAGTASPSPPSDPSALAPDLRRQIERAGRFQTLKEDAKHLALMELAQLRRALLALDRRLRLDGAIFMLTLDEIESLSPRALPAAKAAMAARMKQRAAFADCKALPAELSLEALERLSWPQLGPAVAGGADLRGTRVAGSGVAAGRAFVATHLQAEAGSPLDGFCAGDILVAPFIHPAWLGQVIRSGGVVAGSGGWLSHMAIIARERDVAMVVGVEPWARIEHGAHVRIGMDGAIETSPPERRGQDTELLQTAH